MGYFNSLIVSQQSKRFLILVKRMTGDNTVNVMICIQMALLILLDIRLLCVIQRGKNLQLVKQLPIVSPKI